MPSVTSWSPHSPPSSPQTLRERCQVGLAIIPISYRAWNTMYDVNADIVLEFEDEKTNEDDQVYTPLPSPTPSLIEDSHLVEVMSGLYIALADDEADVLALRTFDNKPFTHVVQVIYDTLDGVQPVALSNWRREETPRSARVQRLDLVCPAADLDLDDADQTGVGPMELDAARDFLSLALPYGSATWWPNESRKCGQGEEEGPDEHGWPRGRDEDNEGEGQGEDDEEKGRGEDREDGGQDKPQDEHAQFVSLAPDYGDPLGNYYADWVEPGEVNALIVAPTERAVDVLSVLFSYLAFLEGTSPHTLVEIDYCDEVWNNVLGPWSMRNVDLIARLE